MSDETMKKCLELMMEQLRVCGVATAQVKDGRVFFFNKEKLKELLEVAEGDPDGIARLFIMNTPPKEGVN